ncbi:hypothetical protein Tco_1032789 [Tanacetum coccineum]|uniref:Uncharacterized protein n=1 Tax=Tanacetum coccineum TaxID=301880 RepID=A0ABQ5GDW3_9ASTR
MKVEESLNVTFDETPPPPKTSPLEDDELVEEEAIECLPLCTLQEDPKTSHLEAVKRIFRYIKGTKYLGLWYPKRSDIETIVYADSNCDNHDLSRLVKLLVLTYGSVAMYGICVICVFVGYVRLDNQSIERDRLNGIGFVLDFMEFISFTFGDKEMISVIEAVSR